MAARFLRPASSSALASVSSSLVATIKPTLLASRHRLPSAFCTMSSASTAAKGEWLAIIPDKPNTLAKRLEVRPIHFANLEDVKKTGALKFGGAILRDAPADINDSSTYDFQGSSLIVEASSKADVIEFLKSDVYYKEGVWDVENAQVYFMKTAIREPLP